MKSIVGIALIILNIVEYKNTKKKYNLLIAITIMLIIPFQTPIKEYINDIMGNGNFRSAFMLSV